MDANEIAFEDDEPLYCTGTGCLSPLDWDDVEDGHSPCCGAPVADSLDEAANYNK